MPELPEVETTRRELAPYLEGQRLQEIEIYQPRMRWPIDPELPRILRGQTLKRSARRGKYLLLELETGTLIVHLGMSGSLRIVCPDQPRLKHDHVQWRFDGFMLRLNDPRRFGALIWHDHRDGDILAHRLLRHLGVEPFSEAFTPALLHAGLRRKKKVVKQALLDGDIVVGVGNIYASESLFLSGINPKTLSSRISMTRTIKLHDAIIKTLTLALESGGSTLRNYVNPQGEPGSYFAIHANVYGREGLPCRVCGAPISKITQNARATFYCKKCQR